MTITAECEKCKNSNGDGLIENTLLTPNNPSNNRNGDHNCPICNNVTNRIYIKNQSCQLFSPEIKGIGWICLNCGTVELDFKWFNPESINKVLNEDTDRDNGAHSPYLMYLEKR